MNNLEIWKVEIYFVCVYWSQYKLLCVSHFAVNLRTELFLIGCIDLRDEVKRQ